MEDDKHFNSLKTKFIKSNNFTKKEWLKGTNSKNSTIVEMYKKYKVNYEFLQNLEEKLHETQSIIRDENQLKNQSDKEFHINNIETWKDSIKNSESKSYKIEVQKSINQSLKILDTIEIENNSTKINKRISK